MRDSASIRPVSCIKSSTAEWVVRSRLTEIRSAPSARMASLIEGPIITSPSLIRNAVSSKPARRECTSDRRRGVILDNIVNIDDIVKNKLVEGAKWRARVSLTSKR